MTPDLKNTETVVQDSPANLPSLELMAVKAVFFDFGDTLVTLSPAKEELFASAARSVGLRLEPATVKRAYQIVDFHNKYSSVQLTDRETFYQNYNEQLCEVLGISNYFGKLHPALIAQFRQHKSWQLMEDATEVLRRLHKCGLPLALVANWDANLSSLAEQLGIKHFFSAIVPSQEVGAEKPDPAIFQRALDALSLSPGTGQIVYVGNEYRADVMGARAAGLTPVLIDRSGVYEHADCLRFSSLLEWLEAME
jgi:putative hydrolase of the HAD superfamily